MRFWANFYNEIVRRYCLNARRRVVSLKNKYVGYICIFFFSIIWCVNFQYNVQVCYHFVFVYRELLHHCSTKIVAMFQRVRRSNFLSESLVRETSEKSGTIQQNTSYPPTHPSTLPAFLPSCLPACLPRLIFSHIRRLGSFVLVQNFEFHFFGEISE